MTEQKFIKHLILEMKKKRVKECLNLVYGFNKGLDMKTVSLIYNLTVTINYLEGLLK